MEGGVRRFLAVGAALVVWLGSTTFVLGQTSEVDSLLDSHEHADAESHHTHDDGDHADEHHDFDRFQRFEHRHETRDGYPVLEVLKTDHAFLERKIRVDYWTTRSADDGRADQTGFRGEFFWALNNRVAIVVQSPLIFNSATNGSNVAGIGDIEVGIRFVAFNGETTILTFGLNVCTPTGDAGHGLGEGATSLEPVALLWQDLGGGNVFQGELAFASPVGVPEGETVFRYNFAFTHTLRSTRDLIFFRWLTPLAELNGRTHLHGGVSGCTIVDITPGLRWEINAKSHAAVGFSFPVTRTREFDNQILATWCYHF
jgi:hypothetical protein